MHRMQHRICSWCQAPNQPVVLTNARHAPKLPSMTTQSDVLGWVPEDSFGAAVLRSSHDLRVTQELMRHSSPASTAIYTQVADLDKVDAIRALGWSA
jgi:site-specific recombinase XerD